MDGYSKRKNSDGPSVRRSNYYVAMYGGKSYFQYKCYRCRLANDYKAVTNKGNYASKQDEDEISVVFCETTI